MRNEPLSTEDGIGGRLRYIRAGRNQPEMAKHLQVSPRTYGYWERNERSPDTVALEQLVRDGWNINWLLTGEGPERLKDLAGAPDSQAERMARVSIAVQLLREAEDAAGTPPRWTPGQQGEATAILVRLLEIGTATAEVRSIADQQIRLFSGGKADGRPGPGEAGVGR